MFPPLFKVSEMFFKASLVPAAVIITDAADGPGFFLHGYFKVVGVVGVGEVVVVVGGID